MKIAFLFIFGKYLCWVNVLSFHSDFKLAFKKLRKKFCRAIGFIRCSKCSIVHYLLTVPIQQEIVLHKKKWWWCPLVMHSGDALCAQNIEPYVLLSLLLIMITFHALTFGHSSFAICWDLRKMTRKRRIKTLIFQGQHRNMWGPFVDSHV